MKKNKLLITSAVALMCLTATGCSPKQDDKEKDNYVNPLSAEPVNWNYDDAWGKKTVGGTKTYEELYDVYPTLCDNIATYNYFAVNSEIKVEDAMRSPLFDDAQEKEGAEFFAELARKIVPDWDSDESRTSAAKQEANALLIYDYIVSHVYYDNLAVEENAVTKGYTLLGMMNNSYFAKNPYENKIYTVCRGYCNLVSVMMNGIGLPCIEDKGREYDTVTGKISDYSDHVWNEVYYGGKWHCIDSTWESNVAGKGYWYNYKTGEYSAGTYDNKHRMFFDIIPDYTSWEDCRNYTNYYRQSHIIEFRNGAAFSSAKLTMDNKYVCAFTVYDAYQGVSSIGGYKGTDTELVLPTSFDFSFDYNGGKKELSFPVASIKDCAFKDDDKITSITVEALKDSKKLDDLLKDTVNYGYRYKIKDQAFTNATKLETVVIKNVDYIEGTTAFEDCTALKTIKFTGDPCSSNGNFRLCKNSTVYYPSSNAEKWEAAIVYDEDKACNVFYGRPVQAY